MSELLKLRMDDPIPTRYTLLSRLQDWGDQESWKDFFDTYWHLIYSVALKSGLTHAEAQDVVQETIICVAKDIPKFKRDRQLGSFKGWLKNITRWRITDQLRKRAPARQGATHTDAGHAHPLNIAEIADPAGAETEAVWEAEWQANLLEAAVQRVKRKVKEEHFQIFDLYVLKHWPIGKVARALDVSRAKIYVVKHRVAALVKKEIRALEEKWP